MIHYFYFSKQSAADEAARELRAFGLAVDVRRAALGKEWLVYATSGEAVPVQDVTAHFETLAERLGGEYDGWERELRQ